MYIYLIDGVKVPYKVWKRNKIFGEYIGAKFTVEEKEEKVKVNVYR